jgi:hypothetical protein
MTGSSKHRIAALAMASAALALTAAPAAAMAPITETSTVDVERPFLDCPGFNVIGTWQIDHKLTFFFDSDGVAIRDIERIDFAGRLVNAATGSWVADSGSRTYFDTLAPDGSYLTTYQVQQRQSRYVHTAGRTNFQTGEFHGRDGMSPDGIDALCGALGD